MNYKFYTAPSCLLHSFAGFRKIEIIYLPFLSRTSGEADYLTVLWVGMALPSTRLVSREVL